MSSHHRILGVPPNATKLQIKRAYFKKAKLLHPDVNKSPNAETEFVRINMAYEALTNPKYIHPPISTRKQSQKTKAQRKREWVKKRNEELRNKAMHAARSKKIKKHRAEIQFYNGVVVPIMTLVIAVLFLIPSGVSIISNYHSDDPKPNNAAVLIGGIILLLGIYLATNAILFIYRKFFK